MAENETPEVHVNPLSEIESALETYIGSDEHGLIYPRLYLEYEGNQLKHMPNIMRCLINRVAQTDPHYVGIIVYEFALIEAGKDDLDDEIQAEEQSTDLLENMRTAEEARLAIGRAFADFAGTFLEDQFIDPKTGLLSHDSKELLLAFSKEKYKDDPLVTEAKRFSKVLADGDMPELGKATVCAATAIADLLMEHRFDRQQRERSPGVA